MTISKALREADHDTNKLFDLLVEAADLIEEQHRALQIARETIEVWHGPIAWDIYERSSPEMKKINAALSALQSDGEGQ